MSLLSNHITPFDSIKYFHSLLLLLFFLYWPRFSCYKFRLLSYHLTLNIVLYSLFYIWRMRLSISINVSIYPYIEIIIFRRLFWHRALSRLVLGIYAVNMNFAFGIQYYIYIVLSTGDGTKYGVLKFIRQDKWNWMSVYCTISIRFGYLIGI